MSRRAKRRNSIDSQSPPPAPPAAPPARWPQPTKRPWLALLSAIGVVAWLGFLAYLAIVYGS